MTFLKIHIYFRLIGNYFSFSYPHKLFHKQGFTYDYILTQIHGNEAKNQDRKQWHHPTCSTLGIPRSRTTIVSFDYYNEGSPRSWSVLIGTYDFFFNLFDSLINFQIDITLIFDNSLYFFQKIIACRSKEMSTLNSAWLFVNFVEECKFTRVQKPC